MISYDLIIHVSDRQDRDANDQILYVVYSSYTAINIGDLFCFVWCKFQPLTFGSEYKLLVTDDSWTF